MVSLTTVQAIHQQQIMTKLDAFLLQTANAQQARMTMVTVYELDNYSIAAFVEDEEDILSI